MAALFKSTLKVVIILGAVFLLNRYAAAQSSSQGLTSLIEEGLKNNPQIQAAYNNWQAARYRIAQVSSLPDPMVNYSYFGENIETRVGPEKDKYGVSQKIPFPGKLDLKAKSQIKNAQMFKEGYEAAKRELIKNIKFTYYDIFWIDKAIEITESEKAILENLEQAASKRYETNLSPQQDVIKAQVEITKMINKIFVLEENRNNLVAKLNSLLNRPEGTPLDKLASFKLTTFDYDKQGLEEMAKQSRQELLAAGLAVQRAEYERSLAKLDYFPDLTLGFDYFNIESGHTNAHNDGQDAWSGTIAFNVPLWFGKLSAQLKEKKAMLEASKNDYQNIENSVSYELDDVYFKIKTYKEIVLLYETALIPQTEQAFDAAKTAYETQKVDFLSWLDSERVLLQTRLAYYKSIVDYEKSIAYLERIVGRDL